jgi:hypothetical protein
MDLAAVVYAGGVGDVAALELRGEDRFEVMVGELGGHAIDGGGWQRSCGGDCPPDEGA